MNDTTGVQWNYWVLMSPQAMAQLIKDMQSPPFRAAVDQAATDMSKDSELIIVPPNVDQLYNENAQLTEIRKKGKSQTCHQAWECLNLINR